MDKKNIVKLFKRELWKDKRKLKFDENNNCIIKKCTNKIELYTEVSVLKYLKKRGYQFVPEIISIGKQSIALPYYKGIRIFNLLVELDNITLEVGGRATEIKQNIINKCEEQQKQLQGLLCDWKMEQNSKAVYPMAKALLILQMLSECLEIEFRSNVFEEINKMNEFWKKSVSVPFRDATTKNMLLNSKKLYRGNYRNEEERKNYLIKTINDNTIDEWINEDIIDFDFSSCMHNTTAEDDVISLKYHERSWKGKIPELEELLWIGEANNKRAAISFFVRYLRFGGRKALYRLIHPEGYKVRFKYDNDVFYFENLPTIMKNLCAECVTEYPNTLELIDQIAVKLRTTQNDIDYFLEAGLGKNTRYYTDVFPF